MPLNDQEVINACQQLAAQENLRVCVTESLKGACIAGIGALAGGLLLGPPGLAVGMNNVCTLKVNKMSSDDRQKTYLFNCFFF